MLAASWLSRRAAGRSQAGREARDLAAGEAPRRRINEMRGRTIVRLFGMDVFSTGFFQAVFDPDGALLRVDLAVEDAPTADLCDLAILAGPSAKGRSESKKPLNLGCFFDPGSLGSSSPPAPSKASHSSTFTRHRIPSSPATSTRRLSAGCRCQTICESISARNNTTGGAGGGGNDMAAWAPSEETGSNNPAGSFGSILSVIVAYHRSLGAYPLVEGEPRRTKVIQQSDGPVEYPHAIARHLDPSFYSDLEQCHVAFLFTAGQAMEGVFQIRRGLDVWVVLLPPSRKLGLGNLRHLFLDGCSAFTFRRDPQTAHLVKTWIQQAPADGLRTVCGSDGGASGLDRNGWRYFGYYNKGESISDSWAFAALDEYVENCPATAAYGSTTREALGSLLTGRFNDQRAEAKAVAISLWAGSAVP